MTICHPAGMTHEHPKAITNCQAPYGEITMREYNPDLITALQADQHQIIVEGQPIQIKRVPDEPRTGFPDPRFLASMLAQAKQMAGQPAIDFAQLTVEQMRQFMGSPNRNLNTIELV